MIIVFSAYESEVLHIFRISINVKNWQMLLDTVVGMVVEQSWCMDIFNVCKLTKHIDLSLNFTT